MPDVNFNGESVFIKIDEALAMIFANIKKAADARTANISNVTITVPSHWEFPVRRLIANAAEIAGFKVL